MRTALVPAMTIHAEGPVTSVERTYAKRKVEHVLRYASAPVLCAHLDLRMEADPARQRPAIAAARLDLDGTPVQAHAEATTMLAAIDGLEARLRRVLERRHRRHGSR